MIKNNYKPCYNSERLKARSSLNRAVREGIILKPNICSRCFKIPRRIEGHHSDYSQPLNVRWLCSKCHNLIEVEKKVINTFRFDIDL